MNKALAVSFAALGVALAGCRGPEVAFTDMEPVPAASITGKLLTVHIGVDTNVPSSEVWVRPKARVKGNTVYVAGYLSYYREQSREYAVRLPASLRPQGLAILWVNPDGSTVPVPITGGNTNQ